MPSGSEVTIADTAAFSSCVSLYVGFHRVAVLLSYSGESVLPALLVLPGSTFTDLPRGIC